MKTVLCFAAFTSVLASAYSSDLVVRSYDVRSSYPETAEMLLRNPTQRNENGTYIPPYMVCSILTEMETSEYAGKSNDKLHHESSTTTLPNGAKCSVTEIPDAAKKHPDELRVSVVIEGMTIEVSTYSGSGVLLRSNTAGDPSEGRLILLQIRKNG